MTDILDAAKSRPTAGGPSYALSHRVKRLIWNSVWLVGASWTPPPFHPWRRFLLKLFGARIADTAHVYGSARIWYPPNLTMGEISVLGPNTDCYCMAPITIGDYAIVSQYAHLCAGTHEIDDDAMQLIARPIVIGRRAWIAAGAFVGPGVTVGEGAVLGARGVAAGGALEPWTVYAGNPARRLRLRKAPETRGDVGESS